MRLGEDSARFRAVRDVDGSGHSPTAADDSGLRNGDTACSAIKQILATSSCVGPRVVFRLIPYAVAVPYRRSKSIPGGIARAMGSSGSSLPGP